MTSAVVDAGEEEQHGAHQDFRYLDDLDCFVVSDEYRELGERLGLTEWSPVVWIGRLFTLDNDYSEHWFDNWHLREQLEHEAERHGLDGELAQ